MTKLPTGRHTQAQKAARSSMKKNLLNKSTRSRTRTYIRNMREMIDAGKKDEAKAALPGTVSVIDKAVSKGAFHKKKASRIKSRILKKLQKSPK
ncbi:MAG: 30S ribosomal protein S20 [Elusimicrobia bacterium]|nr:30S ribosomal protein S20 [Elusimicrobiota bacterium]